MSVEQLAGSPRCKRGPQGVGVRVPPDTLSGCGAAVARSVGDREVVGSSPSNPTRRSWLRRSTWSVSASRLLYRKSGRPHGDPRRPETDSGLQRRGDGHLGVVQLGSTLALGARGRRFDSCHLDAAGLGVVTVWSSPESTTAHHHRQVRSLLARQRTDGGPVRDSRRTRRTRRNRSGGWETQKRTVLE